MQSPARSKFPVVHQRWEESLLEDEDDDEGRGRLSGRVTDDGAPRPSHTTGRAVFGIRRLNLATVS